MRLRNSGRRTTTSVHARVSAATEAKPYNSRGEGPAPPERGCGCVRYSRGRLAAATVPTGFRPGAAEHLGVFLGRDAEVLDRDVDPDRVPPQVRLKSGRLVLGIEDELRDAPAEGPHRLVARRAEVAQIDARDVEGLRVRQTAG